MLGKTNNQNVNKELITSFYTAFNELNSIKMNACYHPDLRFEDPAFGALDFTDTCYMWQMLCDSQSEKSFAVRYHSIQTDESRGSAIWEADYLYGTRQVNNVIHASFQFYEGLIIGHQDRFNLYWWARMALGPSGFIIGWTPFFQRQLKKQTKRLLTNYKKKHELRTTTN